MSEEHHEHEEQDDAVIGKAFRYSLAVILVIALAVVAFLFSSKEEATEEIIDRAPIEAPEALNTSEAKRPVVPFKDITAEAGIDFVHHDGAQGEKLLPETMGGGVAFFDYNGDGHQDLFFVDSATWPHNQGPKPGEGSRLYQNQGDGTFEDVTGEVGINLPIYGQGVAVGDIDGDGDSDLFITAVGENVLLRNDGGRFTDISSAAGVAGEEKGWSSSAGFADLDNDGDLDLFVCNYVVWSREIDIELAFSLNGTDRAYGPPKQYGGTHNQLYLNDGKGTFTDVSEKAGIQVTNPATKTPMGKALALAFADVDKNGYLDVMVANDTVQNFLFKNNGDGTFEDVGALSGLAFDGMGTATGAMGVDVVQLNGDNAWCLAVANFAGESTSLYMQQGNDDPWLWADVAAAEGIGSPSRLKLSFGLFFFDYDLDGGLDMFQANGHLEEEINSVQPSQHYRQSAQLFWNRGAGDDARFVVVPDADNGDLNKKMVGRGSAYADIDNDGDLDLVITQPGAAPMLLRNENDLGHHWLRVSLSDSKGNRQGVGAILELTANGVTQRRQVMPTRSYLSQVPANVTFGLGEATTVDSLRVIWPDGETQDVSVDGVDKALVVSR